MNVRTSYLEYYKTVLDKVSFDHQLFTKEYAKAMRLLKSGEAERLNSWLQSKGLHPPLVYSRPIPGPVAHSEPATA